MVRFDLLIHIQPMHIGFEVKNCHRFGVFSPVYIGTEQTGIFVSFLCLKFSTKFEVYVPRDA